MKDILHFLCVFCSCVSTLIMRQFLGLGIPVGVPFFLNSSLISFYSDVVNGDSFFRYVLVRLWHFGIWCLNYPCFLRCFFDKSQIWLKKREKIVASIRFKASNGLSRIYRLMNRSLPHSNVLRCKPLRSSRERCRLDTATIFSQYSPSSQQNLKTLSDLDSCMNFARQMLYNKGTLRSL